MILREKFSRRLLRRFEKHAPEYFYRIQIQALANLAADSFGCERIRISRGSHSQALKDYAQFTAKCMESRPADTDRLFRDAYELGSKVRRVSGLTDKSDLQRLVFMLYRNIDIFMVGEVPGEISVLGCYFSRFYTPRQCELMSCVDSGIVSGIFGGGELTFSQRITEGCEKCIACFCEEEKNE